MERVKLSKEQVVALQGIACNGALQATKSLQKMIHRDVEVRIVFSKTTPLDRVPDCGP